jgi:hypothetical protein
MSKSEYMISLRLFIKSEIMYEVVNTWTQSASDQDSGVHLYSV